MAEHSWHPDMAKKFVHFTGRKRGGNDPGPGGLPDTPEDRLAQILQQGRLHATDYMMYRPAVCISESSSVATKAIFSTGVNFRGPYEPWALLLNRDACIEAGFRPVVHATETEIERMKKHARNDKELEGLLGRMIRYEPPEADWLHEREWRLPFPAGTPQAARALPLDGIVEAVIVPQKDWAPPRDQTYDPAVSQLGRLWWNGRELTSDGRLELPI